MAKRASFKTIIARQKKEIEKEVEYELRNTGMEAKSHFTKVTRSWQHKPSFKIETNMSPALRTVRITPQGQHKNLWIWVDFGTKPHVIRAKNAPFLKFQSGYSARTAPVAQFNKGTGQSSGDWVQTQEVDHPGTAARKFSETFMKKLRPPLEDRIQAAIKRGIKKANR
jgi:hypothetical protein